MFEKLTPFALRRKRLRLVRVYLLSTPLLRCEIYITLSLSTLYSLSLLSLCWAPGAWRPAALLFLYFVKIFIVCAPQYFLFRLRGAPTPGAFLPLPIPPLRGQGLSPTASPDDNVQPPLFRQPPHFLGGLAVKPRLIFGFYFLLLGDVQ